MVAFLHLFYCQENRSSGNVFFSRVKNRTAQDREIAETKKKKMTLAHVFSQKL